MMDASRLLHWGDLETRRRRASRRGLGGLSPWIFSILAGLAMAFIVGRAMRVFGADIAGDSDPRSAVNLWLAAVACAHVIVLLGAPFRMYWRYDSALLGRTAIAGKPLFTVALIRSLRAAAKVSLPCVLGALMLTLGPAGSVDIALRHLTLVAIAFVWAALFGPAVALAAGAVVASDTARAALSNLAGEFQPPKTSWLGILPGFAGTLLVLLLIALVDWSRGFDRAPVGEPLYLLVIGLAVPLLCVAWALARADAVMVGAVREVSALDQERLAHIELTKPSRIERLVGKSLGSDGARALVEKDASLARRRYPIPFFFGVMGVIISWILAAAAPADLMLWAGTIGAGLGVYCVVMARRYMQPPIEHLRYVRTLPIAEADLVRAKRAQVLLWVLGYMVLGAIPVVIRSPEPLVAAAILGGIALVTSVAGFGAARG